MSDNEPVRVEGKEKAEVYAELKRRLSSAIRGEFWFEACMIEYAIIEDRTSSILDKCAICKNPYSRSKKLKNKLGSISQQIGKGHPVISKKVSSDTIRRIDTWRERRNGAVHRACVRRYDEDEMKDIALEGRELVRLISNDSGKVSRLVERNTRG